MWDVAVVGAGPAGCAAAIELARAGAKIGLLEKAAFPRDKLCGEFLSPVGARVVEELGCGRQFHAAQPAHIERAVVVTASGAQLEFSFPARAYGLSRLRFDHLLARAAQAAGAQLIEKAEIVRLENASQTLSTRDGRKFQSRMVLLASGRHSLLQPLTPDSSTGRTALRPARREKPAAYFAFKAHYQGECAGRVELYFFPGGYCGLAPIEGGLVNLCCLVEKSLLATGSAEQVLARVPALRARLAGWRREEPFLFTGPVSMGWRRPPSDLLAAGDAALFPDPFTGQGMSVALENGRMAARHALSGSEAVSESSEAVSESSEAVSESIEAYSRELRRRFGGQLRAARLLRAATTPWLERTLLRVFCCVPLRQAACCAIRHHSRLAVARPGAGQ